MKIKRAEQDSEFTIPNSSNPSGRSIFAKEKAVENWEKLGKPAQRKTKEERNMTKTCGSAENYVDFTVGGRNHLDVVLNGSLNEIRLLGLIVAPDNTAEVAFQLRMSRGQVKNLVNLLSSWLKFSERESV